MNVVLFGGTGMVGTGVLLECLADPRVDSVLVIGRRGMSRSDPKIREVLLTDFSNYAPLQPAFASCDACFFCLGVSAVGMDNSTYSHLTYGLTLAAAKAMVTATPHMTFCYISGLGTDSTEQSRIMRRRLARGRGPPRRFEGT